MKGLKGKVLLEEIYVLKGIAIIGVILIHMNLYLINASVNNFLKLPIAAFAMQIFMFTSGYLLLS
jgi:fucose 4-O-acetylase-like acetyltransferase